MSANNSDHDLLIALRAEFKVFYDEFRRVSNGTGFHRCAERHGEILAAKKEAADAHKRIDILNGRFWWAVSLIVAQAVGLLFSLLKGGA